MGALFAAASQFRPCRPTFLAEGEFAGAKGPFDPTVFCAVVLDRRSRRALLQRRFSPFAEWEVFAHHMTIAFGRRLADPSQRGARVVLRVTGVGSTKGALAVRVEGFPCANATPHITLAANTAGGAAPSDSNQIRQWREVVPPFEITGRVAEVSRTLRVRPGSPGAEPRG